MQLVVSVADAFQQTCATDSRSMRDLNVASCCRVLPQQNPTLARQAVSFCSMDTTMVTIVIAVTIGQEAGLLA